VNDDESAPPGSLSVRDSEGASRAGALRIGAFRQSPEHLAALGRVKAWTRERFRLRDDATIMVSEVTCALPGCPPLETAIAFWTENDQRHHFKVFKPVADVVSDDLPPSWMKDALVAVEGVGLECC
jgi:hypothetical protein